MFEVRQCPSSSASGVYAEDGFLHENARIIVSKLLMV